MFCFAALADATAGTMYTDITRVFPVRSFKNMQYIFVAYIYDLNAIIIHPMPNRAGASFITAFMEVFNILQAGQYQPVLNIMYNECSKAVEKHTKKNKMKIQLVPPQNHHVNAAEHAIGTLKEHFVSALATIDMLCPLQRWDEFLSQVKLTLNLFYVSPNAIPTSQPATNSTAHSTSAKRLLLRLARSTDLQQPGHSRFLGSPCNRWFLHWPINQSLPLSPILHPSNLLFPLL
jgi:hypothetical protein